MKTRQMELFAASPSRVSRSESATEGSRPRSGGKPSDARARSKANGAKRAADADPAARRAPKKSDGEATAPNDGAPAEVALKRRGDGGVRPRVTAETLAARQREISVSEFFTKNRHLLGFDNPSKALLTTVKEAVDNSLDACEEAHILPDISVAIDEINETRFRVSVEDNGPGIVRQQVPKIFAKLLYGSKFHRLRQSRGQQGIGISAAGLYAQLTTGKPMVITSRTAKNKPAHRISVLIDTAKNQPKVLEDIEVEWDREHGTRVELELTGAFRGGRTSVDAYVEQTVVANPHVAFAYKPPKGEAQQFPRATESLPREPVEIKPHPHGVELGMLMRLLHDSRGQKAKGALVTNFSRVSPATAQAICEKAGVSPNATATSLDGEQIERLHKALGETKVMAPPSSAVVPIGEDLVIAGLRRRYQAEIFEATTRPPAVYRGNPFVVECGIAYGGELPLEEPAELLRFANRVPLQYQPGACAITAAVQETKWRNYTLQQPKGGLPVAPMAIFVHLASVWVPFTSEAKEAIAHYDEILREIQRALQECGRKLAAKLRARDRADSEAKRRSLFERYIPELGQSIGTITGRAPSGVEKIFFSTLPKFLRVAEIAELAAAKARGEPEPPKRRRAEREEAESERTPQTPAPPPTPPSSAARGTPKTNAESEVAKAAAGAKRAKKKRRK